MIDFTDRQKRVGIGIMKRMKNVVLAVSLIFTMVMTSGCGLFQKFDASGYTQAVLDTNFKNDTKQYMKLTNETEDAANAIFNDNADGLMQYFMSGMTMSDEVTARGTQIFKDIMKATKYTVGEAKADGDDFTVEVEFEQVQIFGDALSEYSAGVDAYTQEVTDSVSAGNPVPTDAEMYDHAATILFDILQAKLDAGVSYADKNAVTLHIEKSDDNVYTISDSDYQNLLSYAMDYEEAQ